MSKNDTYEVDLMVEDDEDLQENKYLMCKLGNEVFGIDITYVTDIIELQKITAVPDMPQYVKGVINLRGQVIPVVDLRLRFHLPPREYDDRNVITVVDLNGTSVGYIIDTATEVLSIPDENIEEPPSFYEDEEKGKYISGLGKIGEDVTILLNVERLVAREELESLKSTL